MGGIPTKRETVHELAEKFTMDLSKGLIVVVPNTYMAVNKRLFGNGLSRVSKISY